MHTSSNRCTPLFLGGPLWGGLTLAAGLLLASMLGCAGDPVGIGGTGGSAITQDAGTSTDAGSGGKLGSGGGAGSGGKLGSGGIAGSGGKLGSGGTAGSGGSGPPAKFVGNITTRGQVRSDFITYWDQITPENETKWGSVQPSQGTWNWGPVDAIYKYTQDHNIPFKGHCFVWGSQQPSWVNNGNAETAVKTWMSEFCKRYPQVKYIDVVNEPPPHTTPGYMNGMGGAGASGYDWIANAFKWARAACPNAVLILNDYNTIEYSADNARIIDIATKIKAAGAPIDAIGAQAHDAYKLPTATVKGFIDKLAATGLPVYITEYDINLQDDTQQKNVMQDQFTMFWNHPSIPGITVWGYIVGSTWKDYTGLMTSTGTKRPAMTWLMDFLGR